MPRIPILVMAIGAAAAALAFAAAQAPGASAHPLGNFTINHYDRIEATDAGISVYSVLDLAEIPAFQERGALDANGDGAIDEKERAAYAQAKAGELMRGLSLKIDGETVALRPVASDVTFPPGQGGLSLLRLTATFEAPLPRGWRASPPRIEFEDRYLSGRVGWREIVVRRGAGVDLRDASVPDQSVSEELTRYPDGLTSPLDVRVASFSLVPGAGVSAVDDVPPAAPASYERAVLGNPDPSLARFTELIARDQLSFGVVAVALLAAVGLGAVHALSPGHGKTVVAAYLVGSRGTWKHALLLGLTVTVTHTSSVYALGFAALYLSEYVVPERLYPWLGVASGALIVAMGLLRLSGQLRSSGAAAEGLRWLRARAGGALGHRALAVGSGESGAIVLAPSASRAHGGRLDHMHHDDDQHDHDDGGAHRHAFGAAHSHKIPGQDGEPVTWRQLIGLGIFGGMLPCPSAIVVMLSAISLHRVGFGLVLIVAFSLGLAAVLTGIGFALVFARGLSSRLTVVDRIAGGAGGAGRVTRVLISAFPSAGAAAVVIAGALILLRGLAQQGFV